MVNELALLAAEAPSVGFVCFLGIAVVFIGLICIIAIISLMNALVSLTRNRGRRPKEPQNDRQIAQTREVRTAVAPIPNREEIIAAVCAAVAEENGTDISAIRVISFKKIN